MKRPLYEIINGVIDFFRNDDMTIQLKKEVIYCPNTRRAMSVTLDMIDVLTLVFKEYGIIDWTISTEVFTYSDGSKERTLVIKYSGTTLNYVYKTIDDL